jgi:hypothetical protein
VFKHISGDLPPGLPVNHIATDPKNPDKNLFAGTDFGLYYSTDSGKTWTKELRIPNVAVHEVKMRKDGILFLYTHGRGMWALQLKGSSPLIHNGPAITVYPNPASEKITISLSKVPVWAKFALYDAIGQKVTEGTFQEHSKVVDIRHIRPGPYFLRVETDSGKTTEKLLLH